MSQDIFESVHHPQEVVATKQDFWGFVRGRYLPEVQEITTQLDSGLAVILDAPFGTGKTFNLASLLVGQFTSRDYSVVRYDSKSMGGARGALVWFSGKWKEANSEQAGRLAIIDEIPDMLLRDPQGTEEFLGLIKSKEAKLFTIAATRSPEQRTQAANDLQEIGRRVGIELVVHHLRQTHIPEDLARKALILRGADNDLIEFFLDPENVSLLNPRIFAVCEGWEERGVKTMNNLRDLMEEGGIGTTIFSTPGFYTLLEKGQGGSKTDLVRMLTNLGTIRTNLEDDLKEAELEDVPDY